MVSIAVVFAAAAVVLMIPQPQRPDRRLHAATPVRRAPGEPVGANRSMIAILASVASAVLYAVVGLVGLLVLAVSVGLLAAHRHRRAPPAIATADIILFTDLLAACLESGMTTAAAVEAAGSASDGLLAERSRRVANALRAGVAPADAWNDLAGHPLLQPAIRVCCRSGVTGSASVVELQRIAGRQRAARREEIDKSVGRAAVLLVLPLGACFLPAFVLITVVPVVMGLLPQLL